MVAEASPRLRAAFDWLQQRVHASVGGRRVFASLVGEETDYVRFGRSRIRQAGHLVRARVELVLADDDRQCGAVFTMSGVSHEDGLRFDAVLAELSTTLARLEPDPLMAFDDGPCRLEQVHAESTLDAQAMCATIVAASGDDDLVGLLSAGARVRALASSSGHACYHERRDFVFDYSIHVGTRLAVKSVCSGLRADDDAITASIAAARDDARRLGLASRTLPPGRYRVWLAPHACAELIDMFGWNGLSESALRTGTSPLVRMRRGERLAPMVELAEAPDASGAPLFCQQGFVRPGRLALVTQGALVGSLVSARTAREFGLEANGAGTDEKPDSLALGAGTLDDRDPAALLGDGILIGSLWYLNFSDRLTARVTGTTRFGTFLVEGGRIVGPLAPMRFDDSLLRVFGDGLLGLGATTRTFAATDTYDERACGATTVPGALVEAFALRL